ncbi:MAG: SDR family oxidoreductase, partial [Chloroflexota bacterium]
PESLRQAMHGARSAYYLAHSLDVAGDFVQAETAAARNFARAAREAGLERVVYLSALSQGEGESPHVRSRRLVGEALRESGAVVVEFRASIVIGTGSMPFEVMRALVERLPVMATPKWVSVAVQPIASGDLISYLLAGLEAPVPGSRTYEVGGSEAVPYREVMREYARQRGLRRLMIPVPLITPGLSSWWLRLVTPAHSRMGRRIVDSVRHDSVVADGAALSDFPVRPAGLKASIRQALEDEQLAIFDAARAIAGTVERPRRARVGNMLVERRELSVGREPEDAFRLISSIGGSTGWYWGNTLWRLRGMIDRALGGPGMRRTVKRSHRAPSPGDIVDFWRVEALEQGRMLRLRAEMKLPGRAWLELDVRPDPDRVGASIVGQTAVFDPRGLVGLLYWNALYPIHARTFNGMLRGLARAAE